MVRAVCVCVCLDVRLRMRAVRVGSRNTTLSTRDATSVDGPHGAAGAGGSFQAGRRVGRRTDTSTSSRQAGGRQHLAGSRLKSFATLVRQIPIPTTTTRREQRSTSRQTVPLPRHKPHRPTRMMPSWGKLINLCLHPMEMEHYAVGSIREHSQRSFNRECVGAVVDTTYWKAVVVGIKVSRISRLTAYSRTLTLASISHPIGGRVL